MKLWHQLVAFLGALVALVGGVLLVLMRKPPPRPKTPPHRLREHAENTEARRVARLDAQLEDIREDAAKVDAGLTEVDRARIASELEG